MKQAQLQAEAVAELLECSCSFCDYFWRNALTKLKCHSKHPKATSVPRSSNRFMEP